MKSKAHLRAFTLIELMVVISIIAVLSLIAIPNLLEARVRAKVARVYNDMRMTGMMIELYITDHSVPPMGATEGQIRAGWGESESDRVYAALTTPVAYMASMPYDPFSQKDPNQSLVYETTGRSALFADSGMLPGSVTAAKRGFNWFLQSRGPGGTQANDIFPPLPPSQVLGSWEVDRQMFVYDPTNGAISTGWIIFTNRGQYLRPHFD